MVQLTLRFDTDVERAIRDLAAREGLSLNQAANQLLRKAAGLDVIGGSLDDLIGTLSADDARAIEETVAWADAGCSMPS